MKLSDAEKIVLIQQLQAIRDLTGKTASEQLPAEQRGLTNRAANETSPHAHTVNQLAAAQELLKEPAKPHSLSFLSSASSTLSDVFNLIKDGINGKMNAYLQELLSNAEIMAAVKNKDVKDPNSRKVLEINITIASTMIDKYAGLLEMLLSQKSLSSPQQQLIKDAHQSINRSAERLKRVNLLRGLNSLDDFADVYLFEHHKSNCCFSWFSSTPTKAYQNLLLWFEDLTQEAFSTKELLGAVYAIRSQIGKLRDEEERAAIRDGLDKILKDNACPAFSIDAAKSELREYIEAFNGRMKELKIRWPAPFAEEEAPAFLLEQRA